MRWHVACIISSAVLDPIASSLERYMDLLSVRQKATAANIANADTPSYRAQDIDFATEFNSAIGSSEPVLQDVPGLRVKNDGNNVSLDRESRILSETAIRFNIATQVLRSMVRNTRMAIQEGRSG